MKYRTMEDYADGLYMENERLRKANTAMNIALAKAIRDYGQPGGPWNVPGEPGTWLAMAKQALGISITASSSPESPSHG